MSKDSEDFKSAQIIKNIVKEIEREFFKRDITPENISFITFYVELLVCDPHWNIDGEALCAREKIQQLINRVVKDFFEKSDPDMVTIKIQHALFNTFQRRYEILKNKRDDTASRLSPLKIAILEQDTLNGDLTDVFYKILIYCILSSGMGDPFETGVYKQSRAVLKSMLTMDELKEFLYTPYVIRVDELKDMVNVYTGIRIFNNACNRGGDGVPDVPKFIVNSLDELNDFLIYLYIDVDEKLEILTNAIKSLYVPMVIKNKIMLKLNLPENVVEQEMEYCQRLLLVYKQFEEAIELLLDEITIIEKDYENCEEKFKSTLDYLHKNIVPNFYIHVCLVFPHFKTLSNLWTQFKDNLILLNVMRQVIINIDKMVRSLKFENNIINYFSKSCISIPNIDKSFTKLSVLESADSACNVHRLEDFGNKMKIPFEYKGHCCWTLVQSDGFLYPGDPKYGVVRFNGRFYIFSSLLALNCFIAKPTLYVYRVLQMARDRCSLINFLRLKEDLRAIKDIEKLIDFEKEKSQVVFSEAACQYEYEWENGIDPTYHFSLWQYRADALALAKLKNCKTVSTMTNKVFTRNSIGIQTYFKRDKENMTKSNRYTNTPKPLTFLNGLRGDREGKRQHVFDLTYWDIEPCLQKKDK